ncbi:MAG TPA: 5,10-methylene tetrahydromethanopterin reductase, partial [Gordonia polyisoprenivorans]|nr:5,10-methylene tetrahydromethanopterin reductase [Gordonia polyisoprenivorans]
IDSAAHDAGREPADVRRIANVGGTVDPAGVDAWVEQLTALALDDGFSTFIFADDDPATYT